MPGDRPDHSLKSAAGERNGEKPELYLVRFFQVKEADYMKPPLAEQLLEPDGTPAPTPSGPGVVASTVCTCNMVCVCVPGGTCACNTVCTCNTVNVGYGMVTVPAAGGGGGGGGGGYGGYWAPCF